MAASRRTRRKKATSDREVPVGSFVVEGGEVHGTQSDVTRASKRLGAYAASSVIERGTALKMKATLDDEADHLCICGCGQTPSQSDSLFMPGHDSKVRAIGKAILEGRVDRKDVYGPALEYLDQGGMLHG